MWIDCARRKKESGVKSRRILEKLVVDPSGGCRHAETDTDRRRQQVGFRE